MSEVVDRSNIGEKPSENGANDDGGDAVPEEEHGNTVAGDVTFFPSDA